MITTKNSRLLLVCILMCNSFLAQVPMDGLSHYYPFSGNTDDIIYGNGAISVGDVIPAPDRFGFGNCAYAFGGQDTSLMLIQGFGGYEVGPDSSFSISLWYQFGSADAGDLEHLFYKGWLPFDTVSFGVSLYDLNTPLMYSNDNSMWCDQSLITFPNDPAWHHLVLIFEPDYWQLYFDNQLASESFGIPNNIHFMAADVHFGTSFEGRLDDIAFYNKVLSIQEIDALYNAPSSCLTGLNNLTNELDIQIFPNPSSEIVNLNLKGLKADEFQILSAEGKQVNIGSILSQNFDINISDLIPGFYTIRFQEKGKTLGYKSLIVN